MAERRFYRFSSNSLKSNVSQISRFNEASFGWSRQETNNFYERCSRLFFRIPIRIRVALTRRSPLVYETDGNDQCVSLSQGSGRGSSGGAPKQLGPFCSKHQPCLDILTANNQYDEAHILE